MTAHINSKVIRISEVARLPSQAQESASTEVGKALATQTGVYTSVSPNTSSQSTESTLEEGEGQSPDAPATDHFGQKDLHGSDLDMRLLPNSRAHLEVPADAKETLFLQPFGQEFACRWPDPVEKQQYFVLGPDAPEAKPAKLFFGRAQAILVKMRPVLASNLTNSVGIARVGRDRGQVVAILTLKLPPESAEAAFVGSVVRALAEEVVSPTPPELLPTAISSVTNVAAQPNAPTAIQRTRLDVTQTRGTAPRELVAPLELPTHADLSVAAPRIVSQEAAKGDEPLPGSGSIIEGEQGQANAPTHPQGLTEREHALVVSSAPGLAKALSKTKEGKTLHLKNADGGDMVKENLVAAKQEPATKKPIESATYKFVALDFDSKTIRLMLTSGRKKTIEVGFAAAAFREKLALAFLRLKDIGGDALEVENRAQHVEGVALIEAILLERREAGKVAGYDLMSFKVLTS